ncbi:MAG: nucleotide exchange factor GrpE [Patescibacteria group bacterium]
MSEASQKNNEILEERLAQAEREKNEYFSGWQRARADFINYKKDELKRLEEIAKYGLEDLVGELVTVMDNFDLGLAALEKSGPVEKGIYMIRSQIADILKKRGLEKIEVAVGDSFDPRTSEAIVEIETDKPSGLIVEIIEPGYRLNGKILRATRVKISKNK